MVAKIVPVWPEVRIHSGGPQGTILIVVLVCALVIVKPMLDELFGLKLASPL